MKKWNREESCIALFHFEQIQHFQSSKVLHIIYYTIVYLYYTFMIQKKTETLQQN